MDKSRVVSVYAIRNFKFLGFALGKGKNGVFIRAHAKSLQKAKQKLKELTSRSQGGNVRKVIYNVKVFIRGWLGLPEWRAAEVAYSRISYWRSAHHASVNAAISKKRLAQAGYYSILDRYESLHLCG